MEITSDTIVMPRWNEGHVHLREGELLRLTLPYTLAYARLAVAMGNLEEAIASVDRYRWYHDHIMEYASADFRPLVTVMLVNGLTSETLVATNKAGCLILKWIPGDTSTGSSQGVSMLEIERYYPVLRTCRDLNMVLMVHWELLRQQAGGPEIPELEREEMAIPILTKVLQDIPGLKITVEHITTAAMAEVVAKGPDNLAGGITAHHMVLTCDMVYQDNKIAFPHHYCKPVAKTRQDQRAIIKLATSGHPRVWSGNDAAPHWVWTKEQSDGPIPAGVFCAPVVPEILIKTFIKAGCLKRLDHYTCWALADFLGLPRHTETVTFRKQRKTIPAVVGDAEYGNVVVPLMANKKVDWVVAD